MMLRFRSGLAFLALLIASCATPSDTGYLGPLTMSVVSGDGQIGLPGEELPEPLVARVEDSRGRPVSGQIVNWRVVSGGGSVFAGAAITNRSGLAQERWTLGFSGAQRVEARAVDPVTGEPLTFAVFTATFDSVPSGDSLPPVTSDVNAFPNPAQPTDSIVITAQVSDTFTGGSNIAGAEVRVDSGPLLPMFAGDGAFDQQNEFVTRTLVGIAVGSYQVCVRGRDSAGNVGAFSCITLTVSGGGGGVDTLPPITTNVTASPNPAQPTDSVTITALVSDSFTGHSNIAAAQVELDSVLLMAMLPQDGAFNHEIETVTRTFVGLAVGEHRACVRGRDSAGNVGEFVCTSFTVSGGGGGDTLGPVTINVTATPDSASPGDSVLIRAEVRDTFTGGSNIAGAEVRVDSGGFVPMFPTDGAFDQQNELVNRLLSGLSAGSHTVCVRGRDTAGNVGNETCIGFSVAATTRLPGSQRRGQPPR